MRFVQTVLVRLGNKRDVNFFRPLNDFLANVQMKSGENRILNVQVEGQFAYVTANMDLEEMQNG